MPLILTETDTFSADITVPEGGDDRNSASVNAPIQKLTNRTLNLKNRIDDFATEVVSASFKYPAPVTVVRAQNILLGLENTAGQYTNGAVRFANADAAAIRIPLYDLVQGATMTGVSVPHNTNVGRAGANRASIQVTKLAHGSASGVSIGSLTYETGAGTGMVPITVTGLSEVIDLATYEYYVTFTAGTAVDDSIRGPVLVTMSVLENKP